MAFRTGDEGWERRLAEHGEVKLVMTPLMAVQATLSKVLGFGGWLMERNLEGMVIRLVDDDYQSAEKARIKLMKYLEDIDG